MTNQGAEGTALLTPRGLLTRDSESFGPRLWGAEGTVGVPVGPWSRSLEIEIAGRLAGSSQTVAAKAVNAKRPAANLSASGVSWWAGQVRIARATIDSHRSAGI